MRHVQGFLHGFLVLRDLEDKIMASGDFIQRPDGDRIKSELNLRFRDGSQWKEATVFSQHRTYHLLSYQQVREGPAFEKPGTLSLDTATGNVIIRSSDPHGKGETKIADRLALPTDLANGMLSLLLAEIDPKTETTLSMLVSTPKPRVVKLKIAASGQEPFSIGGAGLRATHYIAKIDIGGLTGAVAKAVGKQPPPVDFWIAAGSAPIFLKSEGPLFEDGPVWRIELTSPVWPKSAGK